MELVEQTIGNGAYHIYVPRHYNIKEKPFHDHAEIRYYLCIKEENNEITPGILYFGTNQNEHKTRFNQKDIIENIETTVLNIKVTWPIYYTENNYFTVVTLDYHPGASYHLIRFDGKEHSKEKLIDLINIFSTLRENDTINREGAIIYSQH
jgi:hypothetical protein